MFPYNLVDVVRGCAAPVEARDSGRLAAELRPESRTDDRYHRLRNLLYRPDGPSTV